MLERSGYGTALYLSALIAIVHCSFSIYALWYLPLVAYGVEVYAFAAVMVSVGLWLQSRIARYIGALFYLFSAGAAVSSFFSTTAVMSVGTVWVVTMAALSVVAALVLVFSRPFAEQFAAEREKRPAYKKYLLNTFTVVIVLTTVVATLNDIVRLVSN